MRRSQFQLMEGEYTTVKNVHNIDSGSESEDNSGDKRQRHTYNIN